MTTSSIGLVEGLTLIILISTGFGLVWRVAQVEKGLSDRINVERARHDINEVKLEHLEDKVNLSTNQLNEKIEHKAKRYADIESKVNDVQNFLQKHMNFAPRKTN